MAEQGSVIIDNIKAITPDYKMGFGSFIDKDVAPFKSTNDDFNCPKEIQNCESPYSFYHRQSLDKIDGGYLKKIVKDSPLAGNVDNPEGGMNLTVNLIYVISGSSLNSLLLIQKNSKSVI